MDYSRGFLGSCVRSTCGELYYTCGMLVVTVLYAASGGPRSARGTRTEV